MKYFIFLFPVLLFSCEQKNNGEGVKQPDVMTEVAVPEEDLAMLEEYYVDSLTIARKGLNKVEIFKYRASGGNYVELLFYEKIDADWKLVQTFSFDKDGVLGLDPEMGDYTDDGLNDLTLISAIAARGGNRIRNLYVFDKKVNRLKEIRNASHYPNLRYNATLNCIDAFALFAGSTTSFLRIEGDSLKIFASVTVFDGLTVEEFDRNGKGTIIYRDSSIEDDYIRFETYKPLKVNEEDD